MHGLCCHQLKRSVDPLGADSEKRLDAAAQADFVICLYNPSSRKRADYLEKACGIILRHRSPETVCGIVRNIGREGESYETLFSGTIGERRRPYVHNSFYRQFADNGIKRQDGDAERI